MEEGITDEALLKEARKAIQGGDRADRKRHFRVYGVLCAIAGALAMGLLWLLAALI